MGFLDGLISKYKEHGFNSEAAKIDNIKHDDIVGTAEMTAAIVNKGLESGDYSEIAQQLDNLTVESGNRQQYVFPAQRNDGAIIFTVFNLAVIAVFLYFLVISLGIVVYSKEFLQIGIVGLCVSSMIILLNINFIRICVSKIRFYGRYQEYESIIRYKNVELLEDIVSFTNIKEELVVKDLQTAIQSGYIPEGHFGTNNMIFMVSDDTNDRYLKKQAVYDRYFRKLLEERHRMGERSKEIQRILDEGQQYVGRIKESNAVIKDKVVTEKLNRMEEIVSMIFREVDINPKQSEKLGLLLNYYLPTTEKLLDAYIEMDNKKIRSKSANNSKSEIERSLDMINEAFEGILERFYEEKELDIVSDISAMETIMKQERF